MCLYKKDDMMPKTKKIQTKKSVKTKVARKPQVPQDSVKYTNMFYAYAAFWRRGFSEWAGTSSRSEYWWSCFVNSILGCLWFLAFTVAGVTYTPYGYDFVFNGGIMLLIFVLFIYGIAAIIPSLSMNVRRLHDAGLSAWWMLLLIPMAMPGISFVASIIMLVFCLLPTKTDGNPYHKFNKQQ